MGLLGWATPAGLQMGTFSINTIDLSTLFASKSKSNVLQIVDNVHVKSPTDSNKVDILDSTLIASDTPLDSILTIQFPENEDSLMTPFYNALGAIDTVGYPIHILHFGDSQIEGDRITEAMRSAFQQKFGGCGTGLLPIVDPIHTRFSHKISSTQSWKKITPADKKSKKLPLGIYCSYFQRENLQEGTQITIKKTSNASSNVAQAQTFTIVKYPTEDSVQEGIEVLQKELVLNKIVEGPVVDIYDLQKPISTDIVVKIKDNTHEVLQAFSFDCKQGISVDNISLRGSSITEFTKMHSSFFKNTCKNLHVKLVILQFGVNVVPYEVDDYSHYENLCLQQLLSLKKLLGNDVAILMIGVSDMSKSQNGEFITYPKLKLIRDAQKKAALRAHCAFWDLYNNMGGKNSMVAWVNAERPLAGPDHTHFTPTGAKLVGNMIYKAIIQNYENYKK